MPLPLEYKEQICSDIASAGVAAGFIVAAELKLPGLHYVDAAGKQHQKATDLVWLVADPLIAAQPIAAIYSAVAAFEVDGFDVDPNTITNIDMPAYGNWQAPQRNERFRCYIPLYGRGVLRDRERYGWNALRVDICISARLALRSCPAPWCMSRESWLG